MNYITSKTHRYIKIRTHPSDYFIAKFHENDLNAVKQFHIYYNTYLEFYKKLVKFITGDSYEQHMDKHMLGIMDATKESIYENSGIIIACANHCEIFCIPRKKENDRIFDYMIENIPCKFKVLKKTRGTYYDFMKK